MPSPNSDHNEARRAYHRELRSVARVLRLAGLCFALIGAVGLLLGVDEGSWWLAPSWLSLFIGAALIFAGAIRRVREEPHHPDQG